jgi:O-antigen/teichoic acid export membrane protein
MDSFIIGRYLGPQPLGLYTRAANLATVPLYMITSAISRVLFPAFSRVQHDAAKLSRTYRDSLTLLFVLISPLGLFLIPTAPQVVHLLLGPRWAEAALPLAVFGATVPFNMAMVLPGIVLDATGTLTRKLHVRFVTLAGAGFLLYLNRNAGIMAIAELMLATSVLTFLAYHFLVVRQLRISWPAAAAPVLYGACSGAIPFLAVSWLTRAFPLPLLPALAADGAILALSYVLILAFSPFPVVNHALSKVLAAFWGEKRSVPEVTRSRCLAWQILETARAEGRP